MALYEQHDPHARAGDPGYADRGDESSVGDTTNTDPSIKTVTPAPSLTTEPQTQAPQP